MKPGIILDNKYEKGMSSPFYLFHTCFGPMFSLDGYFGLHTYLQYYNLPHGDALLKNENEQKKLVPRVELGIFRLQVECVNHCATRAIL